LTWTINFTAKALKELKKIDRVTQRRIRDYLKDRISTAKDARQYGKALQGSKKELWRYRVGNYRILTKIEDSQLIVLVISVGHRSTVYL